MSTHFRTGLKSRKIQSASLLAGLVFLAFAAGCSDDDEGSSGPTLLSFDQKVKSIDAEKGLIITEGLSCDSNDAPVPSFDTLHVARTGDKLLVWGAEACSAAVLTGNSSSIIGKWSSTGEIRPVPDAKRSPTCDPASTPLGGGEAGWKVDDLSLDLDISASKVATRVGGKMCIEGSNPLFGDSEQIESTVKDCNTLSLKNKQTQKTAEARMKFENNALKYSFLHAGKTCAIDMPFEMQDASCEMDGEMIGKYIAFASCMQKTEFFPAEEEEEDVQELAAALLKKARR